MSDFIRREDAIKAIKRIFDQCEEIENHLPKDDPDRTGYKMFPDYMTVWKYLYQLQSIEQKEQTAKVENQHYEYSPYAYELMGNCKNCGETVRLGEKFCHECGTRLEWK